MERHGIVLRLPCSYSARCVKRLQMSLPSPIFAFMSLRPKTRETSPSCYPIGEAKSPMRCGFVHCLEAWSELSTSAFETPISGSVIPSWRQLLITAASKRCLVTVVSSRLSGLNSSSLISRRRFPPYTLCAQLLQEPSYSLVNFSTKRRQTYWIPVAQLKRVTIACNLRPHIFLRNQVTLIYNIQLCRGNALFK